MGIYPQDDIPAPAAVSAVRAAGGHVLLPVEGHRPAAARARPDGDASGVNKLIAGHNDLLLVVASILGKAERHSQDTHDQRQKKQNDL